MKNISMFLMLGLGAALHGTAGAQNLSGQAASVHDSAGTERQTFSNAETITLRQKVTNAVTSPNPIAFTFKILSPAGAVLFSHAGNSAPGTAGTAQTQLAGISINSFYTAPGNYTFTGTASLDGETVTKSASFLISSPNITLIYPPYEIGRASCRERV